tara:strand:+ start:345 stop:926 length:582 start_codon:yes stop_codon:yes gene_type:complete
MTTVDNTRKYTIEELPIDTSGWELKKLRQWVGHDTNMGFSAVLYIDGKKVANVEDDSMGGGMFISPESKEHVEMLNKIRETLKDYPEMFWSERGWDTPEGSKDYMSWSPEQIIEVLIQREDEKKWIKKKSTNCILFQTKDTEEGSWKLYKRQFKISDKENNKQWEMRIFNVIMERHPDVTKIVGFRTREDWSK